MKATIDRKEGEWVVVIPESGSPFNLPLKLFPDLEERDVIDISITKLESELKDTQERVNEIRKGLNKVSL